MALSWSSLGTTRIRYSSFEILRGAPMHKCCTIKNGIDRGGIEQLELALPDADGRTEPLIQGAKTRID